MYIDDELDETLFESHYCCSASNSDFLYRCITCIVVLSTVLELVDAGDLKSLD